MRKLLSATLLPYGRDSFLQPSFQASTHDQVDNDSSQIPLHVHTAFDYATIPFILALLLLSLLSLSSIFHLRLRSRAACKLREFNNLWTIRVLLVFFISYWAINEIIRLPFFRRHYLFPSLPSLSLNQQDQLCKLHVVSSLGFLEPGFLITLAFLIRESVKDEFGSEIRSVFWVLLMTLPTFILQAVSVFLVPMAEQVPSLMIRTSMLTVDRHGIKSRTCTYPLLSCIIFGGFGVVYSVGLLVWCWRVVSLVINRNMKWRIKLLGWTTMMSLLVQALLLGVASFWIPTSVWHDGMLLGMFVSVAICSGVAEVVLVIKPIVDAFVANGDYCEWNPIVRYLQAAEDRKP